MLLKILRVVLSKKGKNAKSKYRAREIYDRNSSRNYKLAGRHSKYFSMYYASGKMFAYTIRQKKRKLATKILATAIYTYRQIILKLTGYQYFVCKFSGSLIKIFSKVSESDRKQSVSTHSR